jgi:N-acetylglucosaminyldiphosphoundecaprenol N-acetyl-beta-D-mannosaminyltransferase
MSTTLLARASLLDVARGRAPLIGSRLRPDAPRGFLSPVEARVGLGLAHETDDAIAATEAEQLAARSFRGDLRTCVSAAIGMAVTPASRVPTPTRPLLVSTRVDNVTADEAVARILARTNEARARMVHFVHPHALNLATLDDALRLQLAQADLVLADGVGLRVAARILGLGLHHNVNGTDLLPRLCGAIAAERTPLVLIGAAPGVAERCAANLRAATPGLEIPLVSDGFLDPARVDSLRTALRGLGRAIVLVGMGTPRQESFAWSHLADLPGVTAVTVGGLFDFFAGDVRRAPRAVRELGLEWAYRIAQEPRRLFARYALGNPAFLALAAAQALGVAAAGG